MMMMGIMGCNSGLLAAEKARNEFLSSMVNLRKGFIEVFVIFGGYGEWDIGD